MNIIADLHIHGRYSRGCSTELDILHLEKYAKIKGLNLLGTGDFTHPKWLAEIENNLTEDENGILKTANSFPFLLQTEISLIYTQDNKGRRVHNIVLAPNLSIVKQIIAVLLKKGRIDYDGRPIFNISCPEFVELMRQISEDIEVIPAHVWTPWFGLLGFNSGFDSVEEAFQDQTKHIHALETGLSSDPIMNWRLSKLDKYNLVSFSDAHSYWPWRIGREATLLDIKELTYKNIIKSIRTGEGLTGTIEVDPNFGKYHFTGHRACGVRLNPKEALKVNNICPKCKRILTVGVLQRIEKLADRSEGSRSESAKDFKVLIPLPEILASVLKKGITTQTMWREYNNLITAFSSEFEILLNTQLTDLIKVTKEDVAKAIIMNRENKIRIAPGYDGVYGEPNFDEDQKQKNLTDF